MKLNPIDGKGNENLYRHPISENIYFKMFRKGRGEVCKSTKTKSVPEARVVADDYRIEFFGSAAGKIKRGRKFCGELFPEWITRKAISTRPGTIASISSSWKHFEPFIATMLPEEITSLWWETVYVPKKRKEVRLVMKQGEEREVSQADRKFFNDRKWLSMFLLQLKRDGVLKVAPKLVEVDPPIAEGRVYTDDEVAELINCAEGALETQILMAVTMGMRVGEIMGMNWDRINMKAKTMHLRACDTKTKQARTFGISKRVYNLLLKLERGGPLFPSPDDPDKAQTRQGCRTAWCTCKRNAKVVGRFHWLRHTFLTKAFKQSTNPALICEYAGLSLKEAQDTYLHFTPDDTRVVSTLVDF